MPAFLRTLLLLTLLALGGSCAGAVTLQQLGGAAWQALVLGLLLLPSALAAALTVWRISYSARGCLVAVLHLMRRRPGSAPVPPHPRGGVSLLLVPPLVTGTGGALMSYLSPLPITVLLSSFAAAGLLFGLLLLLIARAGLLDELIWRETP